MSWPFPLMAPSRFDINYDRLLKDSTCRNKKYFLSLSVQYTFSEKRASDGKIEGFTLLNAGKCRKIQI